jgi:hypothetical protein
LSECSPAGAVSRTRIPLPLCRAALSPWVGQVLPCSPGPARGPSVRLQELQELRMTCGGLNGGVSR